MLHCFYLEGRNLPGDKIFHHDFTFKWKWLWFCKSFKHLTPKTLPQFIVWANWANCLYFRHLCSNFVPGTQTELFPLKPYSSLPRQEFLLSTVRMKTDRLSDLRTSAQFSHSVVSNSLRSHGLQHSRPPCPSPTPGVHPNSCPLSQWCHPTISSSVIPFSSCLQSCSASGSFQMSLSSSHQVAKVLVFQLQYQFFQWTFRIDFL